MPAPCCWAGWTTGGSAGCAGCAGFGCAVTVGGELSYNAVGGDRTSGRSSRGGNACDGGAGVSTLVSLAFRDDHGAAGREEIVRRYACPAWLQNPLSSGDCQRAGAAGGSPRQRPAADVADEVADEVAAGCAAGCCGGAAEAFFSSSGRISPGQTAAPASIKADRGSGCAAAGGASALGLKCTAPNTAGGFSQRRPCGDEAPTTEENCALGCSSAGIGMSKPSGFKSKPIGWNCAGSGAGGRGGDPGGAAQRPPRGTSGPSANCLPLGASDAAGCDASGVAGHAGSDGHPGSDGSGACTACAAPNKRDNPRCG